MKRCPDCRKHKPLSDFPRNRSTSSGRGAYCKPCHNARTRATIKRLHGNTRNYHLRGRYGVDEKTVDQLIDRQGGYCVICFDKPAQQVDHDHRSGKVRGVLCFNCNGGLGQFGDNIGKLRSAIEYLEANGIREY